MDSRLIEAFSTCIASQEHLDSPGREGQKMIEMLTHTNSGWVTKNGNEKRKKIVIAFEKHVVLNKVTCLSVVCLLIKK